MEILHLIYSSNFLLTYATITAVLIVIMVVINVYDYYTIHKKFSDLDKKRKRSKYILENLKALNKSSLNEKELKNIMKKWSQ